MTGRATYHQLPVVEVVDETPDARSLVLQVPAELAASFAYRPGQFLTVRVPHPVTGSVARCYSLSSSPYTDRLHKITVKRVEEGYVSNWICDRVGPGTQLDTLPPAGSFTPGSLDSNLLLVAGGSGITPVMSIIKAALAEGRGHLMLVYANRYADAVIFADELHGLQAARPQRLEIMHWYDAEHGAPSVAALGDLMRPYADREAFVCGPEPYMAAVGRALGDLGTPPGRIHVEHFLSGDQIPAADAEAAPERDATVEVTIDGQTRRLPWPPGTRLLDVLIEAGLNPPFSCRQGICGACTCRVLEGDVKLVNNEILEAEDFAEGYTLACQALPRTETVIVTYS